MSFLVATRQYFTSFGFGFLFSVSIFLYIYLHHLVYFICVYLPVFAVTDLKVRKYDVLKILQKAIINYTNPYLGYTFPHNFFVTFFGDSLAVVKRFEYNFYFVHYSLLSLNLLQKLKLENKLFMI